MAAGIANCWHECVFKAYSRQPSDAICLTVILDAKARLPHA